MTQTVSVDEAQNKLSDLLADALAGNEVIITEHGTPVARLVPVVAHSSKKKRVAGLNRGSIFASEDFDEPLPDEFWLGQE
jgi:prevent-host-death family protein